MVAVEDPVRLVGPHDLPEAVGHGSPAAVVRDVLSAAGATHEDRAEYDRVMAAEHRTVVLWSSRHDARQTADRAPVQRRRLTTRWPLPLSRCGRDGPRLRWPDGSAVAFISGPSHSAPPPPPPPPPRT